MRRGVAIGLVCVILAIGCTGDDQTATTTSSVAATSESTAAGALTATTTEASSATDASTSTETTASTSTSTSASTTSESSTSTASTEPARPAPDPVAGASLSEICTEVGLAMIVYAFDTLQDQFPETCCGDGGLDPDSLDCQLDWPFSDVPACTEYDHMRNAIYARYGFPFQSARYREQYAAEDWYEERSDFDPAWLSPQAEANIATLVQLADDEVACTP